MNLQEAYDDAVQAVVVRLNYIRADKGFSDKEKENIREYSIGICEESANSLYLVTNTDGEKLEGAFNDAVSSLSTSSPHTTPEVDGLRDISINRIAEIYKERTGQKPSLELE